MREVNRAHSLQLEMNSVYLYRELSTKWQCYVQGLYRFRFKSEMQIWILWMFFVWNLIFVSCLVVKTAVLICTVFTLSCSQKLHLDFTFLFSSRSMFLLSFVFISFSIYRFVCIPVSGSISFCFVQFLYRRICLKFRGLLLWSWLLLYTYSKDKGKVVPAL